MSVAHTFAFTGSGREYFGIWLVNFTLSVVTLGLYSPWAKGATWGTAPFHLRAGAGEFYGVYLSVLGLLIAMGFGAAIVMLLSGDLFEGHPLAFLAVGLLAYGTMALAVRAVLDARVRALAWGQTWAGDHRVVCFIEPSRLFVLMATNLLATILTLGLFQPFAQIRMARYLADVVYVITAGSLDDVEAGDQSEIGAAGDESVGMLDFDIAL